MSEITNQIPSSNGETQKPQNDNSAEINFAKIRKKLESEMAEKEELKARTIELERERDELLKSKSAPSSEDDDDEPYVDGKKLKREMSRYGQEFEKKVEEKVQRALEEERKATYLKENSDFDEVLSKEVLQGFVEANPRLAKAILRMPDGFERDKLVYENIKALKAIKEVSAKSSIQDKIDSNRRSPYYQGSSTATPPFGGQIDPKSAYKNMQDLKARLRLG